MGGHVLGHLDSSTVRMTTGFAGGVGGSRQEMCGAFSAGVMVIGALHGRSSLEEDSEPARQLATLFRERVAAELGTTRCAPLYEQFHAPDGSGSCSVLVERVAQILLDLLAEGG